MRVLFTPTTRVFLASMKASRAVAPGIGYPVVGRCHCYRGFFCTESKNRAFSRGDTQGPAVQNRPRQGRGKYSMTFSCAVRFLCGLILVFPAWCRAMQEVTSNEQGVGLLAKEWRERMVEELQLKEYTFDLPMSKITSFRVGGPADLAVEAATPGNWRRSSNTAAGKGSPGSWWAGVQTCWSGMAGSAGW